MPGYCGYSKSNNAIAAEEEGKATASALGRALGVSAAAIKQHLSRAEWHHTSLWYNATDYYEEPALLALVAYNGSWREYAHDDIRAAIKALRKLRAFDAESKAAKRQPVVHLSCRVEWLEWSGTRNRPICTERCEAGCTVAVKGKTATIMLPNGKNIVKRLDTRGFKFDNRDLRASKISRGSSLFGRWCRCKTPLVGISCFVPRAQILVKAALHFYTRLSFCPVSQVSRYPCECPEDQKAEICG